jgi:hypothetical protein
MDLTVPKGKTIIFRLIGGPCDGTEVRSETQAELQVVGAVPSNLKPYWDITGGGTIGKKVPAITGLSLAELLTMPNPPLHEYEVIDRQESHTEVLVVCEHRGRRPSEA